MVGGACITSSLASFGVHAIPSVFNSYLDLSHPIELRDLNIGKLLSPILKPMIYRTFYVNFVLI